VFSEFIFFFNVFSQLLIVVTSHAFFSKKTFRVNFCPSCFTYMHFDISYSSSLSSSVTFGLPHENITENNISMIIAAVALMMVSTDGIPIFISI